MRLKVIDKNEGNEVMVIDITSGKISIDTKLSRSGYGQYVNDDGEVIVEVNDNIISYVNEDYQLFIDN